MKPRIINTEPSCYSEKAREILCSFADLDETQLDRNGLLECINNYDGLIVRLGHFINSEVFDRAPQLKVVATATTGLNHIDVVEASKRNVKVISLKGEREFLDTIHATAEHTWGLILSLVRNIPGAAWHAASGGWNRELFRGRELYGKTLGIIGLGRLGTKVSHYALAFGMKVLACDPNVTDPEDGVALVSIEELLGNSDIISIHVPFEESTKNLIDRNRLKLVKKGAYLINTSRGEVIDEKAMLDALIDRRLSGAALDVLTGEHEHNPDWLEINPLRKYSMHNHNLIITPHIGGATWDSMGKTEIFIAEKLKGFFNEQ